MATNTDLIQQLYVAYFNRPADVAGLNFWLNAMTAGATIDQISKSFNSAKEYTDAYAGKSAEVIVNTVYQNLFGRTADSAGLDFWGPKVQSGAISVADLVKTIAAGALNTDGTPNADGLIYANKVTAASTFTTELNTAGNEAERLAYASGTTAVLTAAKNFVASVTSDASLATAIANVHATAQSMVNSNIVPVTTSLTTGVDNVTGGTGVNVFNGSDTTLTGLDVITGVGTNNTLNLSDVAGSSVDIGLATISNIQTANLTSVGGLGHTGTQDYSAISGLTAVNATLRAYAAVAQTLTVSDSTALTVNATGTTGTVTLKGGNVVKATVNGSTVGTVTVQGKALTNVSVTETDTVAAGAINVTDTGVSATKAGTLATVSLDGVGASSTITSNALTSLTLANDSSTGAVNMTVTNSLTTPTNTTLNLTLNNFGTGNYTLVDTNNEIKTLKVTTAGGKDSSGTSLDSALAAVSATGVTALTVAGTNLLTLTSAAGMTNLATVAVSGSAGLTAALTQTTVTGVDTSATTGTSTVTINGQKATFTGGAGKDIVTLSTTAPTKAIALGAGDDTIVLASGTTAMGTGGTISGGAGTDTLSMDAADAATASGSPTFATQVTGFEKLTLNSVTTNAVDLAQLGNYNNVSHGAATALTLNNMASGGTVTITANTTADTVNVSNAATGTADSLNLVLSKAGALTGGTVTVANVEALTIAANDTTASVVAGTNTDTLTLVATAAKTLVVTGNANLTLTNTGNTALTSIDASGMTGGITVTTAGTVAETVKGGAASNSLTAGVGTQADVLIGGAKADTLTNNAGLTTLTGGAGNDTFVIDTVGANVNTYTTITDGAKGDIVSLKSKAAEALIGASMTASKIVLGSTAVFQDYANAVVAAGGDSSTNGHIGWFSFGGDTYIVESMHDGSGAGTPSFVNGTDLVVKLTGVIDLTKATFASGAAAVDATITLG